MQVNLQWMNNEQRFETNKLLVANCWCGSSSGVQRTVEQKRVDEADQGWISAYDLPPNTCRIRWCQAFQVAGFN